MDTDKRINCFECRHYFVTWDAAAPRGCRFFGFKSLQMPSIVVQNSSGRPCEAFTPKNAGANRLTKSQREKLKKTP
ncbi:MAG TPA: uracil-DNA glycosylase [Piscirickettsiaceae bacterium]|nr:uracil-DNA glycosylase [Piscirickettsiaceae bacterium]